MMIEIDELFMLLLKQRLESSLFLNQMTNL